MGKQVKNCVAIIPTAPYCCLFLMAMNGRSSIQLKKGKKGYKKYVILPFVYFSNS
jgi:hypothetical protein